MKKVNHIKVSSKGFRVKTSKSKYCFRCGTRVKIEKEIKDYPYYCPTCDENMYEFEVR